MTDNNSKIKWAQKDPMRSEMTLDHTVGMNCPYCAAKLKKVHPKLIRWFLELVKPRFPHVHIYCGYRDEVDQEIAYEEVGKEAEPPNCKLRYPKSAHNRFDGSGYPQSWALDLFALSEYGVAIFPYALYSKIKMLTLDEKWPIKFGLDSSSLGDCDHFELMDDPEAAEA